MASTPGQHEAAEGTPARVLPPGLRDDTWVVIAAFNEGSVIAEVAAAVRRVVPNVVVVDDGSADDTAAQARVSATHVLKHVINRGQGASLQTGISFALSRGARCIVTFDADGQHDAADIPRFVEPIAAGEADYVLGSRFLDRESGMPWTRRLVLRLGVLFTRVVNRLPVTDAHNGFRAFSRKGAEALEISADRMSHASQLIDLIRASGLPFKEIGVTIRYSAYSLGKGQRSSNAIRIALHHLVDKILD